MYTLSENEEWLCKEIVDAAYLAHKGLGPGLLERINEVCFCHELKKKNISYRRQVDLPIIYDRLVFDEGLRLDALVENRIICEIKAVESVIPLWQAQLLSHLKMTGNNMGFLINFYVPLLKNGIRRFCIE